MAETKNVKRLNPNVDLAEMEHTNCLFLDLLYNLSKYPHPREAKYFVRKGLFEFEERNVFRASKAKINNINKKR